MPASALAIKHALHGAGVRWLVSVANGEGFHLYEACRADPEFSVVSACREGEAIGIAAGLRLGGQLATVSMENLGLFECLDTLRALPVDMRIPMLLMIGYVGRGGAASAEQLAKRFGNSGSQVAIAGDWTERVLALAQIPCRVLDAPGAEAELVNWALRTAAGEGRAAALLFEGLER
jgi:sulfopyruvate decarboxylase TPP-binding subunit